MVAGVDGKELRLYTSDVTGNYVSYYATAIGESDDKIKGKLREKYKQDLTIKKGVKLAMDILEEVKGKRFDINRFELAYVKSDVGKLKRLEGNEIKEFVKWKLEIIY